MIADKDLLEKCPGDGGITTNLAVLEISKVSGDNSESDGKETIKNASKDNLTGATPKAFDLVSKNVPRSFHRMKSNIFSSAEDCNIEKPRSLKTSSHFNIFGNSERSFPSLKAVKSEMVKHSPVKLANETNSAEGSLKEKEEKIIVNNGFIRKVNTRGGQVRGGNPITGEGYKTDPNEKFRGRIPPGKLIKLFFNSIGFVSFNNIIYLKRWLLYWILVIKKTFNKFTNFCFKT